MLMLVVAMFIVDQDMDGNMLYFAQNTYNSHYIIPSWTSNPTTRHRTKMPQPT